MTGVGFFEVGLLLVVIAIGVGGFIWAALKDD